MKTFIVKNLGCKVNQYEGQVIREQLEARGLRQAGPEEACDVVIVNTCTVTGEADRKSRYEIRRLNRLYPKARIVATGCYAERDKEILKRIFGVTLVVGQREKSKIIEHIERWLHDTNEIYSLQRENRDLNWGISRFPSRSRAFVKVQDGCNKACTFCKVVLVRGKLRSRPPESIIAEVERVLNAGYKEIVLTGIQLGAYGKDRPEFGTARSSAGRALGPAVPRGRRGTAWPSGGRPLGTAVPNGRFGTLVELMRRLVELRSLKRLRLSSINPYDITDELINFIASEAKCCSHLHVPLQSGSNKVLDLMKRGYTREQYLERIARLREAVYDFQLTMDCMVGFPGETEKDFLETLGVLKETKPLKIHAFPFSPRSGTKAYSFPNQVPKAVINERMRRILDLGAHLRREQLSRYVGKQLTFLIEEFDGDREMVTGITENFVPIAARGSSSAVGEFSGVTITGMDRDLLLGNLIGDRRHCEPAELFGGRSNLRARGLLRHPPTADSSQ